jgi:hypothetical protein
MILIEGLLFCAVFVVVLFGVSSLLGWCARISGTETDEATQKNVDEWYDEWYDNLRIDRGES